MLPIFGFSMVRGMISCQDQDCTDFGTLFTSENREIWDAPSIELTEHMTIDKVL